MFLKTKKIAKKNIIGMTLMETLIYILLFGIIITSLLEATYGVIRINRQLQLRTDINKTMVFVAEHIEYSFERSESINEGLSTFDNSDGVLTLNSGTNTIVYSIVDGRIITENTDSSISPITITDAFISNFNIDRIITNSKGLVGIQINITVESKLDETISKNTVLTYLL